MCRIYLSGAITGTDNYAERFARAEEKLIALGYEVINPARVNAELPPMEWEEYMHISLAELSLCDAIYMLRNYKTSMGAQRELGYAMGAGMRIMWE